MGGGATWGETESLLFVEEKHETGYALEIWYSAGEQVLDTLTVPQVEDLAGKLKMWAETMRKGGHYKDK